MRLNVQDAARLLQVSEKSIYRWLKQGVLPAFKVNEQYRFNRAELLAWATSRRLNVPPEVLHEPHPPGLPLASLEESLAEGGIVYRLEGRSPDEVLEQVARAIRLPEEVDRAYLASLLQAREALAPTALGRGFAAPQLVFPNVLEISRPVAGLFFLERPLDFGALDGTPVHTLIALISPVQRASLHLLNRVGFALQDRALVTALTAQKSREELLKRLGKLESSWHA